MNRADLETKKIELQDSMNQVNSALLKAQTDVEQAERELDDLNRETFSKALVDFALGRISRSHLLKIKRKIFDLKEVLSDFQPLTQGLEAEKANIGVKIQNVTWKEKTLKKYEVLKGEAQEKGLTRDTENNLLGLARELDCVDEAKSFIDGLKVKKT